MIKKVKEIYNNYGLWCILGATVIFLLGMWLIKTRNKESGSYNKMNIPKYVNLLVNEENNKVVSKKNSPITDSKGELECRRVLQDVFKVPFPKARPDFLYNKITGHNLELDMFNPHLKIACEYNGKQHYVYNKWMHNNSQTNFHNQKYRDEIKMDVCRKLGIHLIVVPYTIQVGDIEDYIVAELKNKHLIK
jgi:hypothetical protein